MRKKLRTTPEGVIYEYNRYDFYDVFPDGEVVRKALSNLEIAALTPFYYLGHNYKKSARWLEREIFREALELIVEKLVMEEDRFLFPDKETLMYIAPYGTRTVSKTQPHALLYTKGLWYGMQIRLLTRHKYFVRLRPDVRQKLVIQIKHKHKRYHRL